MGGDFVLIEHFCNLETSLIEAYPAGSIGNADKIIIQLAKHGIKLLTLKYTYFARNYKMVAPEVWFEGITVGSPFQKKIICAYFF